MFGRRIRRTSEHVVNSIVVCAIRACAKRVAARTYALASIVKNRDFDLYADPRSQMYYGVAAETPTSSAGTSPGSQVTAMPLALFGVAANCRV